MPRGRSHVKPRDPIMRTVYPPRESMDTCRTESLPVSLTIAEPSGSGSTAYGKEKVATSDGPSEAPMRPDPAIVWQRKGGVAGGGGAEGAICWK